MKIACMGRDHLKWNVVSVFVLATATGFAAPREDIREKALKGLSWRSIGPADMGGRVVDIAGIPGDAATVYMASASGGLWKTTNNGTTWQSIFESGNTLSLGAVAVAPSDPNVIYVGTGEHNPRNSASIGDGVYRSTDAGKTWTHVGLQDTEKIARIRIHPGNPDIVYVAALGHEWGPNPDRGIFRSTDGGRTWQKVLHVNEDTGASDLAMSPGNPRVLFAGMYDFRRQPWHFRSGGPGSGLYRSTDGGETWLNLTDPERENGLPRGVLGRIGVAVSSSNPRVVYAVVESKEGVLWRSDDAGESWRKMTEDPSVNNRPFYYSEIRVDPANENRVYAISGSLSVSDDGGKTWRKIGGNIHGDHQAFWIDPDNPKRLLNGNDGGWAFSYDRGETWDFVNVAALGQFYQVAADMRDPYYVCGGLQDNDVWCGPSRTLTVAGSLQNDWYEIHGPGDGMYVQINPTNPNDIYTNSQAGDIIHFDLATGEGRSIHPYPVPLSGSAAGEHPYRFNWNAPVHMSPHDPKTVYFGANLLFRTSNGGHFWEAISPDLTTNDPKKLESSGGPITADNTSAEYHCTIFTISESPVTPGLIWVGTDDGNVQLTRDRGASWTNVVGNLRGLPAGSWVSRIEASRRAAGTAYAAFDRHQVNDPSPYVFKTTDYGKTWANITDNLPRLNYVHVVREDPRNPDLIYVGTELGIFASWSGGGNWTSIRLNLPPVAVRDILVHPRENDLIIGAHGRSIWILDDITPLQQLGEALAKPLHVFAPRPASRYSPWKKRFRADVGDRVFIGENPPFGGVVTYYLKEDVAESEETPSTTQNQDTAPAPEAAKKEPKVTLTILDSQGQAVRKLEGPGKAGLQRIAWDLRHEPIPKPEKEGVFRFEMTPPQVLPGEYRVSLKVKGEEAAVPITVRVRADLRVTGEEIGAQHDALLRLKGMAEQAVKAVQTIDDVKSQLDAILQRMEKSPEVQEALAADGRKLVERLAAVREELARPASDLAYRSGPKLLDKVRGLSGSIGEATAPPTEAQAQWVGRFEADLEQVLGRFRALVEQDIPQFGRRLDEAGIPRIVTGQH